ncbi:MAG: Crp/Fnr family transcriptional regulator [Oscillospiraceae bacterium]|nr:Crp/Fnr family transcriptional regulator [Oscillospiraceae bacterium]
MNADWKSGPLFAGISEEGVDQVLACLSARPRHFDKQAMLLRAGDAPVMGIVLAGSVHILQEDFWGNRSLLGRAGPGDLFAEAFACAGVLRLPVSVEACEPTNVLLLDAGRLSAVCPAACPHHAKMIRNLLRLMAEKNVGLARKVEHMARRTTRDKLLSYLSAEARRSGGSAFSIPFNRQQLADYLAVDRSAMCSELSRLRDEGLLDFHRSAFVLRQELERI